MYRVAGWTPTTPDVTKKTSSSRWCSHNARARVPCAGQSARVRPGASGWGGITPPHRLWPNDGKSLTSKPMPQVLDVEGHQSLEITADPLGKVYPHCIGQSLWSASIEMVKFFDNIPDDSLRGLLNGRWVLELGAGLGAAGMALGRKGARVACTDQESMLPLLQHNVTRNFPEGVAGPAGGGVSTHKLQWESGKDLDDVCAALGGPCGLIIGSDVIYDKQAYVPLLETVRGYHTRHGDAKVILSLPDRPDSRGFFSLAHGQGYGWRLLRRVTADPSLGLAHDCLIVELFPAPHEPQVATLPAARAAGSGRTLVVCDFDWSIVEENSDTFVLQQLGAAQIMEELEEQQLVETGELSWTALMDGCLVAAQERLGATAASIRAACRAVPMDEGVIGALTSLAANDMVDMHILSDANSVYISEILRHRGLEGSFDGVHTNPAAFDSSGALRVRPFSQDTHWCSLCPKNLCKGLVIERLLTSSSYSRLVYVGDGSNDFCPSCRSGPWDAVLAREVYPDGRKGRLVMKSRNAEAKIVPTQEARKRIIEGYHGGSQPQSAAAGALRGAEYRGTPMSGLVCLWTSTAELTLLLQAVVASS